MILDATTKSLQIKSDAPATTTAPTVSASYVDTQAGATFVPGAQQADTNGTTAATIVSAPGASTQRQIKQITVYNVDTVVHTLTVYLNVSGTLTPIQTRTLAPGEALEYNWEGGWRNASIASYAAAVLLAALGGALITQNTEDTTPDSAADFFLTYDASVGSLKKVKLSNFFGTKAANLVYAGPVSGSAAVPAFRSLVSADMPWSLTQGSVVFMGASNALTQDNANFFWDATNHRLGIGTVSPGTALEISLNASGTFSPSNRGINVTGADATITGSNFTGFGQQCVFNIVRVGGTFSARTAVVTATTIGGFQFGAWDGAAAVSVADVQAITTENFGVGANGTKMQFRTTKNATTGRVVALTLHDDTRTQHSGAMVDLSYSYQAPATGATITIPDICDRLILNPAGTIATLTINMPAAPKDGQKCRISSTQIVTALTQNGNGNTLQGGLGAFAVSGFGEWTYVLAQTTWFRTG